MCGSSAPSAHPRRPAQGPGIAAFFAKAPAGKDAPIGSPAAEAVACAAQSESDKQSDVKAESDVKPDLKFDTGLPLHTNPEAVKSEPDMKPDMKAPPPDKTAGADGCDSPAVAGVAGSGERNPAAPEQLQHQSLKGKERTDVTSGPADPAAGPGESVLLVPVQPPYTPEAPVVTGCVRAALHCLSPRMTLCGEIYWYAE